MQEGSLAQKWPEQRDECMYTVIYGIDTFGWLSWVGKFTNAYSGKKEQNL